MKCPRCGAAIESKPLLPGERILCPGCGKRLKLPDDPTRPPPALETSPAQTEVVAETLVSNEEDGYSLAPSARSAPPIQERTLPSGLSPKRPSQGPLPKKKPPKKTKSAEDEESSQAWVWVVGGSLVTLCLLGGGAATAFWLSRPDKPAADQAVAANQAPAADTPPAGNTPPRAPDAASPPASRPATEHSLVTVDKTDVAPANLKRPPPAPDPDGKFVRPVRPGSPPSQTPEAIWDLQPDPAEGPPEAVADDLDIPLEQLVIGVGNNRGLTLPLFSSRGGRFALIAANEPLAQDAKTAARAKRQRQAKRSKRQKEAEQPPSPPPAGGPLTEPDYTANVVDLHSGDVVGQFAGKNLLYGGQRCRLSPDAKYLISIDTQIQISTESRTLKEGLLFVWHRGEKEPAGTIQMAGDVLWCDFLGPTQLGMLTFEKKGSDRRPPAGVPDVPSFRQNESDGVLHIWDVAKRTELKTIPISSGPFYLSRDARPSYAAFDYNPAALCGAVSPGGRYVALGLAGGVGLVSVEEGREIGSIPMETSIQPAATLVAAGKGREIGSIPKKTEDNGAIEHRALQFSPDGTQLWNLALCMFPRPAPNTIMLTAWDFASGRSLRQAPLADAISLPPGGRPSGQAMAEATSIGNVGYDGSTGVLLPGPEPDMVVFCKALDRVNVSDHGAAKAIGIKHRTPIFELYAGSPLTSLPFVGVRWAAPSRILAIESTGDNEAVLRAIEFDATAFKKTAGPMLAAVAPRPDVLPTDRSSAPLAKPQPPETWTAPPIAEPATSSPPSIDLPEMPLAVGTGEAALLTYVRQQEPRNRNEYHWQRFDLRTGKPIGEPIRLWPWIASVAVSHMDANTRFHARQLEDLVREGGHHWFQPGDVADRDPLRPMPLAALTLDDGRLAACDPANPCRVDVWTSEGARVAGLVPYGDKPIEWLGWSAGGKLLTISAGTLTAWDAASGKALYEVAGDFAGPVAYGAGRKWLALAHAEMVDLIDAESGLCLARCSPTQAGGVIEGLGIAPDGKTLVAARRVVPREKPSGKTPGELVAALNKDAGEHDWLVDVWNLADGKSTSLGFGKGQLDFMQWLNDNHLLVASGRGAGRLELYDRLARSVVASYNFGKTYEPNLSRPAAGLPLMAATGDRRIWLNLPVTYTPEADRYWRSVAPLRPNTPIEELLVDPSRTYIDTAEVTVRVEVDLATPTRGRLSGERLAREVAERGYHVGPSGFALRYTHEVLDSAQRFNINAGKEGIVIPQLAVKWELLDNKGQSVWKTEGQFSFRYQQSRYYDKTRKQTVQEKLANPGITIDWYNFKGQEPRQAILDELLDDAAGIGLPPYFPQGQFIFAQGQFVTLPQTIELPNPHSEQKQQDENAAPAAGPGQSPKADAAKANST